MKREIGYLSYLVNQSFQKDPYLHLERYGDLLLNEDSRKRAIELTMSLMKQETKKWPTGETSSVPRLDR